MQFGLTETQQVLKNSAREFFPAECPVAEVRRLMETPTAHDEALWKKIAGNGWCGIIVPEEHDGLGLGMVELAAAMEEMGRVLLPGPYLANLVAGAVIANCASAADKAKYLPGIANGSIIATLALLETSASWDLDAVRMPALASKLTGRKMFVPDAAVANVLIAVARGADGKLELHAVDPGAAGVKVNALDSLDKTRRLYEVVFENAAGRPIASGGAAEAGLRRALDIGAMAAAAESTGGMQKILETTVSYAQTRKQFGKPIGAFQAVQMQCADILVAMEASRSASLYAAYALGHEAESATAVSVAKAYASEAYRECGNKGIQCHGGMGFTWENDLHLYYRRAKGNEVMFGDACYHRERIARQVVG